MPRIITISGVAKTIGTTPTDVDIPSSPKLAKLTKAYHRVPKDGIAAGDNAVSVTTLTIKDAIDGDNQIVLKDPNTITIRLTTGVDLEADDQLVLEAELKGEFGPAP